MQEDKLQEMSDSLIAINVQMQEIAKFIKKVDEHETFINQLKGGLILIVSGAALTGLCELIKAII